MQKKHILEYNRFFALGSLVIAILLVANIALIYNIIKTSSIKDVSNMPRLNINPFAATALLFKSSLEVPQIWEEPKTILILGRSGQDYISPNLTDSVMVLWADSQNSNSSVKLISIPRDLLVKTQQDKIVKINSLWSSLLNNSDSVEILKTEVENVTGLNIDNIIVFNLATVEEVIEKLDGVSVYVPKDIHDPRFPGKNGYETFSLERGLRYLDAQNAVRFVRTRNSASGDFDRIERQQELLKAIKGKVSSLNPIWNFPKLWSLFNTLEENIVTDLAIEDIQSLWNLGNRVKIDEIEVFSLEPSTGLVKSKMVPFGNTLAYTLVSNQENEFDYSKIQEAIKKFLISN